MFKVLFSTKWIVLTLIVLIAIPAFKELSDWQYRRLVTRQDFNESVKSSLAKPVTSFELIAPYGNLADLKDEWRPITATGKFLEDQQYFLRKRSLDSQPGLWVVTPFKLVSGQIITVVRGWTPAAKSASETPALTKLPNENYEIYGRLRLIGTQDKAEPADLPIGQRINLNPEFGLAYLELTSSIPTITNNQITSLPAPKLTEGPHRSYAIQWLIFIVMLVGGYAILLWNDLFNRRELPIV